MDVTDRIKAQLSADKVVLFMKGSPDFPQCGFSAQVAAALQALGTSFSHVNILEDPEIREGLEGVFQLAHLSAAVCGRRTRGRLRHHRRDVSLRRAQDSPEPGSLTRRPGVSPPWRAGARLTGFRRRPALWRRPFLWAVPSGQVRPDPGAGPRRYRETG